MIHLIAIPSLITRSVINQKENDSLPLADGDGSVGDPASKDSFSLLLFRAAALTLGCPFDAKAWDRPYSCAIGPEET
jgi:hypothetical protein